MLIIVVVKPNNLHLYHNKLNAKKQNIL